MKFRFTGSRLIALSYFVLGTLWILLSDSLLGLLDLNLEEMQGYQTFKGLFFITITTVLLYTLIRSNSRSIFNKQKEVRKSEKLYKHLFENNPAPMWVYDMKTLNFLQVNDVAIAKYGYSREEFLSMSLLDIRPEDDHKRLLKDISEDKNLQSSVSGVWRHKKKNGDIIFVEITSHPFIYADRNAKLVLAFDVTKRMKVEEEVAAVIDELDNFVYRASHDLRGPLARLKGLTYLALLEVEDNKAKDYFKLLDKTAQNLDNILQRLLVVNNLKSSQPEIKAINIKQYFSEICGKYSHICVDQNINLINDIPDDISIAADDKILQLAVENMLENAIQFRNGFHPHYIKLTARRHSKTKIKIFICDNGTGIPEDLKGKIFNIFFRGNEKSDGSGLGLYIAKTALKKMNGTVQLEPSEEKGTVFSILLPEATMAEEISQQPF